MSRSRFTIPFRSWFRDKAGGYGIQDAAGSFVVGIVGCYYNVTGFPLHKFCLELHTMIQKGIFT